jgi:hypothetical protein
LKFKKQGGILVYKGRIYISKTYPLKPIILQYIHDNPMIGHSCYGKILEAGNVGFLLGTYKV